jgi:hypothetical protein
MQLRGKTMKKMTLLILCACNPSLESRHDELGLDGGAPSVDIADTNHCVPATFDSAGIQDCVDAVAVGSVSGVVELPAGKYWLNETIFIRRDFTAIRGAGIAATILTKMTAGPMFSFEHQTDGMSGCSLRDVYLYSHLDGVTAVYAHDQTEFVLRDVRVLLQGEDTTGLDLRTRDTVSVDTVTVHADRPVTLGKPGRVVQFDHTNFHNTSLVERGLDDAVVFIDPETAVQELTFDGYQAWVGGVYGLYWGPEAEDLAGKSSSISIKNLRREQASSEGHSIYIERSAYDHLDRFSCENCTFARESHGVFLLRVLYPAITMSTFDGAPGKNFLAADLETELYTRQNLVVETE